MSEVTWTDEELNEFDDLVEMVSSRSQVERIAGRLGMDKFIKKHGKEKCDAMFSYLEGRAK